VVGERTYECAHTFCNPAMSEIVHKETRLLTHVAIPADTFAIDLPRVLKFSYAYTCRNASWSLRIGAEYMMQWSLKVAVIIGPHIQRIRTMFWAKLTWCCQDDSRVEREERNNRCIIQNDCIFFQQE
jgi:hypothetical protein